jgi:hypothetical protein
MLVKLEELLGSMGFLTLIVEPRSLFHGQQFVNVYNHSKNFNRFATGLQLYARKLASKSPVQVQHAPERQPTCRPTQVSLYGPTRTSMNSSDR